MRNCRGNSYVTRHPRRWGCVVAYEIQNKMHIYPLCPNMHWNVDYCRLLLKKIGFESTLHKWGFEGTIHMSPLCFVKYKILHEINIDLFPQHIPWTYIKNYKNEDLKPQFINEVFKGTIHISLNTPGITYEDSHL